MIRNMQRPMVAFGEEQYQKVPCTERKAKCMFLQLVILAMLLLLTIGTVSAIGVSPARKYFTYEDGHKEVVKLKILSDGSAKRISLYAQGPLAPYVSFESNILTLGQGDGSAEVFYTVAIPPGLKPGMHETDIIALELPDVDLNEAGQQEAKVFATTAVASKLQVQVPYPGKYVQGKVLISEGMKNEFVTFKLPLYNFGEEAANAVKARVEIFGPTNELIGEVDSNTISLPPKKEETLVLSWLANVDAGRYLARITVYYDDKKISFEETFNVGDLSVRMKEITVDPFALGDIAKFNIDLQSIWNQPITGIYADAIVLDSQQQQVAKFKSTTTDLDPQEESTIHAFWDTEGITEGRYDVKFVLRYGGKTTEKIFQILLTLNGIESSIVGTGQAVSPDESLIKRDSILIILVFILVMLNGIILYKFMFRGGKR